MCQRGVTWIRHYIDDFITLGAEGREECERNLWLLKQVCEEAGMPTEPEKDEGPAMEGTGVPGHGTGLSETADPGAAGKIGEAEEHPTGGAWHESLPEETSAVSGRNPEP